MDGNRRWAKKHKFEILIGHNRGAEQIETIVIAAAKKKIPYVTFWAFSTENWNRSKGEVAMLIKVFRDVLSGPMAGRLINKGVKLQLIGDFAAFPKDIVEGLEKLMDASKDNKAITATIAINYGGRAEILSAVNTLIASQVKLGMTKKISEEEFASFLYTVEQPDPDMIVRTGGEQRLSGFLPWQSVYSELYFTDTLWPDFDEKAFDEALEKFTSRERRFGK
jgi:undecaprenyl diphosphate synthase